MSTKFHKGAFAGINLARAMSEPRYAIYDGDNFVTLEHTHGGTLGGYDSYGSDANSATMVLKAQLPGIALEITTDNDTDDGSYLSRQTGATDALIGPWDITIDSGRVLAFESKFKIVQGTDVAIAIGLGEYGNSDQDTLVDTSGALIDEDFIGFHCAAHTTDVDIDGVTRISGGSMIVGAENLSEDEDDTFHVYGFRFDGGSTIEWFYDNVGVKKQTIVSATFPTGQSLNVFFGIKTIEAVEKELVIDYWKCVELLISEDQLAD